MRNLVLFVDSSLFGGIESHIVELVKLLQSKSAAVAVLFYQDHHNTQLYEQLNALGCRYDFLAGKAANLYYYLKQRPDIVLHTHGYKAGIIGRLTCKVTGHVCISTYHAGEQGRGKVRLYNWLDHITSCFSHNLVVAQQLQNKVSNSQFLANFIVPSNPPLKSPQKHLKIAFVGRLSYEKAPDRFVALAQKFETLSYLSFHIYGDGNMAQALKQNAPSNLQFHGHQSERTFWQDIDVLVICSREEGLPMVLLEAIDNKVLCVANRVGAIDTVISHNHTGLLTRDQSLPALISSIKTLVFMAQNERNYLIKNAYSQLLRFYSGHQQYQQLSQLYFSQV